MSNILTRINSMGLTYTLTRQGQGKTRIHCIQLQKSIVVNFPLEDLNQGWYYWMNGKFVQDAFRFLSAAEREFIMTGITSEEWDELFPDDDEDKQADTDSNGDSN